MEDRDLGYHHPAELSVVNPKHDCAEHINLLESKMISVSHRVMVLTRAMGLMVRCLPERWVLGLGRRWRCSSWW